MIAFWVIAFVSVAILVLIPCWLSSREEKQRQTDQWVRGVVEREQKGRQW